jgi:hypothetical protein
VAKARGRIDEARHLSCLLGQAGAGVCHLSLPLSRPGMPQEAIVAGSELLGHAGLPAAGCRTLAAQAEPGPSALASQSALRLKIVDPGPAPAIFVLKGGDLGRAS